MNKPFRKRFDGPRLTPVEADRQGRVARTAHLALGAEAPGFLNTHHETLGGRPLDLAIASDAGLDSVEQAIAQLRVSAA